MTSLLRIQKFNQLMLHRVREVLLVSTPYDSFVLQEDGNLSEQIFLEYKELSLSSAPHVTHVNSEEEALLALEKDRFDLVLRVARFADTDLVDFARKVKVVRSSVPVVVLGFDNAEMTRLRSLSSRDDIESVFLWSGDAKILLAIIKEFEDRANLDHDIEVADIRVILVVEDSIRYYSAFLSAAFPELMKQSQSLFSEGSNRLDKLLRMRTRPKIIHATSFEEALRFYEKYRDNLLALITDVGYPRGGSQDPEAGLRLVERVRSDIPDLPILVQSANAEYAAAAQRFGTLFVNKNSPALLHEVRRFLTDYLGFGAFVFRLPSGEEVAQAKDVRELAECIRTVPATSLEFHTRRNHVSNWLLARSEFDLAAKLRPKKVGDFASIEDVRNYLLKELQRLRRDLQAGAITDFSTRAFDPESLFQRVGEGSLGGKARGLAFLNSLLTGATSDGALAGLQVCIPQTFVLTTDAFDRFLEDNLLHAVAYGPSSDARIIEAFLAAPLPTAVEFNLRFILENVQGPLAVRSSSLLEDDMLHPFAGIYRTVMIPNNDDDPAVRLSDLCRAVKLVFASTFSQNAKTYIGNTANRIEEEKMAVVIQRLVGQRFGSRFYPHFSGVAHSYNFYPLPPLTANDGVVELALGLGRLVVDGGECLRFCPRYPGVLPQFASPGMVMKNSQRSFYALDMGLSRVDPGVELRDSAIRFDLDSALVDNTLPLVGSIFDIENGTITEGIGASGPWVVTFYNILKHQAVPLAPALDALLTLATSAMGTPVELEFACDMGDFGRRSARNQERLPPVLNALQLRPILARDILKELPGEAIDPALVICRSTLSLGHGRHSEIGDVVYVKNDSFDPARSPIIAQQVGMLNERLTSEHRPYLLIGPGRWGSADHWLGIPVQWSQISSARVIVEASPKGFNVDPSQGSHFFHNITSLRLGYLTIPPGALKGQQESFVDWEWLNAQPACTETEFLRHLRPTVPLTVELDGRRGLGVVAHGI